jgi:hypothetical protein
MNKGETMETKKDCPENCPHCLQAFFDVLGLLTPTRESLLRLTVTHPRDLEPKPDPIGVGSV